MSNSVDRLKAGGGAWDPHPPLGPKQSNIHHKYTLTLCHPISTCSENNITLSPNSADNSGLV